MPHPPSTPKVAILPSSSTPFTFGIFWELVTHLSTLGVKVCLGAHRNHLTLLTEVALWAETLPGLEIRCLQWEPVTSDSANHFFHFLQLRNTASSEGFWLPDDNMVNFCDCTTVITDFPKRLLLPPATHIVYLFDWTRSLPSQQERADILFDSSPNPCTFFILTERPNLGFPPVWPRFQSFSFQPSQNAALLDQQPKTLHIFENNNAPTPLKNVAPADTDSSFELFAISFLGNWLKHKQLTERFDANWNLSIY